MSNKFTNNVRARLYKQGYQGFTKHDYTEAAIAIECDDLENPTKEQLSQAVDYLKLKVQSQISVADELVGEKFLSQVESEQAETTREPEAVAIAEPEKQIEQEKPALVPEITQSEGISLNEETQPQPSIEQNDLQAMPAASQRGASLREAIACEDDLPEATAIELQETSELVASTAESMGIALNIEDVTAIASNFDYASTNSDDELEEIKAAITAFVQHKAALSRQKINHIVQEVKDTIHRHDAENSELLNEGLRSISQDIKSGSERFRQQTRQALKVFALPPSKAG
ncbi:hypothetical protein [Nodularia chucula]|uniref:hypothetical protein n=1 Tax=Nodularia chucula TaxID=3093667 RepID=UPI0039C73396